MAPEPSEIDPAVATRSAAAATITRILEEVGVFNPVRVDFEAGEDGGLSALVVIEQDVCELHCSLTREGDLISARLIEL